MARKKAARITRTPEEHRLIVEALDKQQRERSAQGKTNSKAGKVRKTPSRSAQKTPRKQRLYEIERFARE